MRSVRVAAATALVLTVAACSSSGHHSSSSGPASTPATSAGSPSASTPATASAPASPASASTPSGSATSPSGVTTADIRAALLTPDDVGGGFTDHPFRSNAKPLPCAKAGSPPFSRQAPTALSGGVDLLDAANSASLSEELRIYPDATRAAAAQRIATAGLACSSGNLWTEDGTAIRMSISRPQDVTSAVGGTKAVAWNLTSSQADVVLVAVRLPRGLVLLSFAKDPATNASTLPNPMTVAKTAVQKIESS